MENPLLTAASIAGRAGLRDHHPAEDGEDSVAEDAAVLVEDERELGLDEDGLGELVEVDTDVDFEHLPSLVTPTVR